MQKYEVIDGTRVDRTARLPPMSFDQIKCAEGVFEALPQSMIQSFVVMPLFEYFSTMHVFWHDDVVLCLINTIISTITLAAQVEQI
eukprot:COSAG05_NODE_2055_length_3632_cov_6.156526_3_plen_86_part_00